MPSNLNKIKIKDIREFGMTSVQYKGFTVDATEEEGQIELIAHIGKVEVMAVCADTMKEAKELLTLELNDVTHTAEEIVELAEAKNFTGQYDDLVTVKAVVKPVAVVAKTVAVVVETVVDKVIDIITKPLRGSAAREEVQAIAETMLSLSDVSFEQRGKYNDWFIMSKDASGDNFEQRLDVFKKKLRALGAL
jgi:hypothetical protein